MTLNKNIAQKLQAKSVTIARNFSNPDREHNGNGETFAVRKIIPLSETTAAVTFNKNTGKIAIAFCYYINQSGGQWQYFFPSDSHLMGMKKVEPILDEIEKHNFRFNFTTEMAENTPQADSKAL